MTLLIRMFKEMKPKYITDAERKGYSWMFYNHQTPEAEINRYLKHSSGSVFWLAVRNATWFQVFTHCYLI